MKKIFFDAIRSEAKTTTLRYWRRPMVRPGSVHSIPGLGAVRIEDVQAIYPEEITDDDARADGFADPAGLSAALTGLYTSDQRRDRTLYKVTFTLLASAGPSTPDRPAPRRRASACSGDK